jgi:hypothetical protein
VSYSPSGTKASPAALRPLSGTYAASRFLKQTRRSVVEWSGFATLELVVRRATMSRLYRAPYWGGGAWAMAHVFCWLEAGRS